MDRYKFDGVNVYEEYNLIIEKGIDSQLLQMPSLKDNGLSINWADENGTERYTGLRRFEERVVQIHCTMVCSSETEMMAKYGALESFLLGADEFTLTDENKGRYWKVFYSKMTSLVKIGHSLRFTLELVDNYPTEVFTT